MQPKDRIIVSLDVDTKEEALDLVDKLSPYVGIFKVHTLVTKYGPSLIDEIQQKGMKVFWDTKFHDIPNTVGLYSKMVSEVGVDIFNIHCSGGSEMMKAAAEAVKDVPNRPKVIGVTVLTSIDEDALKQELRVEGGTFEQVLNLAKLAKESGLDGVVCSPQEVEAVRQACGEDFLILTPGIRPAGSVKDDQKRPTTPKEALEKGSDYLVIGRPIVKAEDPVAAAKSILEEISS